MHQLQDGSLLGVEALAVKREVDLTAINADDRISGGVVVLGPEVRSLDKGAAWTVVGRYIG